jgi:hypothetical protein
MKRGLARRWIPALVFVSLSGFGAKAVAAEASAEAAAGAAASAASEASSPSAAGAARDRSRDAVAAPNVRVAATWDFGQVESASTRLIGPTTVQTLRVGKSDVHAFRGQLVGTLPVYRLLGVRAAVEGGYEHGSTRTPTSGDRNDFDASLYGGSLELLLRDPKYFAFSFGGTAARDETGDGVDTNRFGAKAGLAAYFPDLGAGPVDWNVDFQYRHANVSGDASRFGSDGDTYAVSGTGGWYLTPNVLASLGGAWQREKRGAFIEERRVAMGELRWQLPISFLSTELRLGGSFGESEFKLTPYPPEDRLVWSVGLGIQIRQITGRTLVELRRGYD